jgi:hypothetical protein
MTKNKFYIYTIVGLLITNLLLIGFFIFRKPPHPKMDGPKKIIINSLHFDKNQIAQYDDLIVTHQNRMKDLKDKLNLEKGILYETLNSKDNNELKRDSILLRISKIETEIEKVNYQHFLDIKNICKPNQMGNFEKLTSKLVLFFSERPKK